MAGDAAIVGNGQAGEMGGEVMLALKSLLDELASG